MKDRELIDAPELILETYNQAMEVAQKFWPEKDKWQKLDLSYLKTFE